MRNFFLKIGILMKLSQKNLASSFFDSRCSLCNHIPYQLDNRMLITEVPSVTPTFAQYTYAHVITNLFSKFLLSWRVMISNTKVIRHRGCVKPTIAIVRRSLYLAYQHDPTGSHILYTVCTWRMQYTETITVQMCTFSLHSRIAYSQ